MAKRQNTRQNHAQFKFEYITCTVSLQFVANQGDGVVVHVLNDGGVSEHALALIYRNTGAGAAIAADSGSVAVTPSWQWGLGFTIPESGEYWVRVRATSEFLVPKVLFERFQNGIWVPVESYHPGDFAIFRLRPTRKRLW